MSEEKKKAPAKDEKVDEELADLLDSALEDFKKEPTKSDSTDKKTEEKSSKEDEKVEEIPQEWSEEFIQQATSQFEANFANLLSGGNPNVEVTPEMMQQKLQQMAEAAQQVLANPNQVTDQSTDFASSISQAIQGLNQGAEGLQNPFSEEDLMRILGGSGAQGQENDIFPFMQGMMQGLLSKEVLGPSLKDFVQRLPEYIEKNRATLSNEDIERYENQRKLMMEVGEELDKENETDSADVKKERFTKVLGLMQKLQDYGQPPAELVGDVEAPFNFDPQRNPADPNMDCSIM